MLLRPDAHVNLHTVIALGLTRKAGTIRVRAAAGGAPGRQHLVAGGAQAVRAREQPVRHGRAPRRPPAGERLHGEGPVQQLV